MTKIIAHNKEELNEIIQEQINLYGNNCDLNVIDVSRVKDMSYLFCRSEFNGNISQWDVSNVTDMEFMFVRSDFTGENGDIKDWNVEKVENMMGTFAYSPLNNDLTLWKPYLADIDVLFNDCDVKKPYWAQYYDIELRRKAILEYWLHHNLTQKSTNGSRNKV